MLVLSLLFSFLASLFASVPCCIAPDVLVQFRCLLVLFAPMSGSTGALFAWVVLCPYVPVCYWIFWVVLIRIDYYAIEVFDDVFLPGSRSSRCRRQCYATFLKFWLEFLLVYAVSVAARLAALVDDVSAGHIVCLPYPWKNSHVDFAFLWLSVCGDVFLVSFRIACLILILCLYM